MKNNAAFSKQEILKAIASSKILEQFLQQNSCLGRLMNNWDSPDIHFGQEFIPTIYQKQIFERRMKMSIEHADEYPNTLLNGSTLRDVLTFIENDPEGQIFTIVFNCPDVSFDIWCGFSKKSLHVIGAMKGGHIPDEAFGDTTK